MYDADSTIRTIDAVLSDDQSIIQLQFVRGNGLTTYINIPAEARTRFVRDVGLAIEGLAIGKSLAQKEADSRPILPG